MALAQVGRLPNSFGVPYGPFSPAPSLSFLSFASIASPGARNINEIDRKCKLLLTRENA